MYSKIRAVMLLTTLLVCQMSASQRIALKTNLVYDALLVPSLGAEYVIGQHSSLNLNCTYNPFSLKNCKWRNWSVQPEYRWWLHRALTGPFVGVNAIWGGFNVDGVKLFGLSGEHRQGPFYGGGVSVGWHHILSNHFSVELTLSADYVRSSYDCISGGMFDGHYTSGRIIPTGTGINLIYVL